MKKEDLNKETKELIHKAMQALDDAHYAIELAHDAVLDEILSCSSHRKNEPFSEHSEKHEHTEDCLAALLDWFEYDSPYCSMQYLEKLS